MRLSNENEIGAFPLLWENMYLEILKERLFLLLSSKTIIVSPWELGYLFLNFLILKSCFRMKLVAVKGSDHVQVNCNQEWIVKKVN